MLTDWAHSYGSTSVLTRIGCPVAPGDHGGSPRTYTRVVPRHERFTLCRPDSLSILNAITRDGGLRIRQEFTEEQPDSCVRSDHPARSGDPERVP